MAPEAKNQLQRPQRDAKWYRRMQCIKSDKKKKYVKSDKKKSKNNN